MNYARMPNWMVGVVALGSVVVLRRRCSSSSNSEQPRILLAMARDGFLPPVFARVHPRYRTPHVATILTGILVGTVGAFANIDEMVDLTNIGTLFAFILVCLGIIILRFRDPGRARPFRVPFGPVLIPGLGRFVVPGSSSRICPPRPGCGSSVEGGRTSSSTRRTASDTRGVARDFQPLTPLRELGDELERGEQKDQKFRKGGIEFLNFPIFLSALSLRFRAWARL